MLWHPLVAQQSDYVMSENPLGGWMAVGDLVPLTLMLVVANLANTKWCKKPENDWNPKSSVITQLELSNEYQHDRV